MASDQRGHRQFEGTDAEFLAWLDQQVAQAHRDIAALHEYAQAAQRDAYLVATRQLRRPSP